MTDHNKTKNQNEVPLPTPRKKNDDVTTGNDNQTKPEQRNGDTPEKKATWQQDKLNEANNQKGTNVNGKGKPDRNATGVDDEAYVSDKNNEKGSLGDAGRDSLTDRPKTETYEKDINKNTGNVLKDENFTHKREEEKRQKRNDDLKRRQDENKKERDNLKKEVW
jgi:hypothetical protein